MFWNAPKTCVWNILKGQPPNYEQMIMTLCHNIILIEFTNIFSKDVVVRKQG